MAASRRWRRCSGCCRCCARTMPRTRWCCARPMAADQRLLPVLCQDHGLTPAEVVAIAKQGRRWRRCSGCCRCCARTMA
ncbi:hypothetical protein [Xanthomonas oryzae]|uniref:hypothetical protein n=1 Tax=Xanthomonas oryzae TaxID=347 RepID=UPI003D01DE8F